MGDAVQLHVLRVFCAPDGTGGNPLGVFLEGERVPEARRQEIAADLGFAETVFVTDREQARLRIHTPEVELPLAGHPLVGAAWLLREAGHPPAVLRPPIGEVTVRFDGETVAVAGDPVWGPPFRFLQVGSPDEVDGLTGPPEGHALVGVWAWIDEDAGILRERVFVPELGITEDEATGSAAMLLASELGRPIEIRQGRGSVLSARPVGPGQAEVGGRVVLDERRDYPLD